MKTESQPTSISLLPIDVGFDLKVHPDMDTALPPGPLSVRYLDEHGEERTVIGDAATVSRELTRAGYRVASGSTDAEVKYFASRHPLSGEPQAVKCWLADGEYVFLGDDFKQHRVTEQMHDTEFAAFQAAEARWGKSSSVRKAAESTNAAAKDRDAAVEQERNAQAEILAMAIDMARPSLKAIGNRVRATYRNEVDGPGEETTYHDGRFVYISDEQLNVDREQASRDDTRGPYVGGPVLAVRGNGTLCELTVSGHWTRWQGGWSEFEISVKDYATPLDAVKDGWTEVEGYVERLGKRFEEAAPGLKSRADKARKNVARLRAVAELLKK